LGTAGPDRTERAREILRGGVARTREGKDPPPLPDRDLGQNVGGSAEAIKPERLALPGHAIAAPADQAGAEQRRGFSGIEVLGQREREARIRQRVRRIAAIAGVAGEDRRVAEILAA